MDQCILLTDAGRRAGNAARRRVGATCRSAPSIPTPPAAGRGGVVVGAEGEVGEQRNSTESKEPSKMEPGKKPGKEPGKKPSKTW